MSCQGDIWLLSSKSLALVIDWKDNQVRVNVKLVYLSVAYILTLYKTEELINYIITGKRPSVENMTTTRVVLNAIWLVRKVT